mmetsp:Transcript_19076/g.35309  ORF Transcript_19076/g.35309 Transcript_19076/m.35309 type:complete len:231 (-) Transcript_19076:688-1380(-)
MSFTSTATSARLAPSMRFTLTVFAARFGPSTGFTPTVVVPRRTSCMRFSLTDLSPQLCASVRFTLTNFVMQLALFVRFTLAIFATQLDPSERFTRKIFALELASSLMAVQATFLESRFIQSLAHTLRCPRGNLSERAFSAGRLYCLASLGLEISSPVLLIDVLLVGKPSSEFPCRRSRWNPFRKLRSSISLSFVRSTHRVKHATVAHILNECAQVLTRTTRKRGCRTNHK